MNDRALGVREGLLLETLVLLAGTGLDGDGDLDVPGLLAANGRELLGVSAVGVMLIEPSGGLTLAASSGGDGRAVEVFEVELRDGPARESLSTGDVVAEPDVARTNGRWPDFTPAAVAAGFRSVQAVPMKRGAEVVGVLNLLDATPGGGPAPDLAVALARAGAAGILQHRALAEARKLSEQLARALDSRVVIEQAKGVLAERARITVEEAFGHLRTYARTRNLKLAEVARRLLDGDLGAAELDRVVTRRGA